MLSPLLSPLDNFLHLGMSYSLDYIIRKDKINSHNECPICLRYTINRKNYKIPLGESVKINCWDEVSKLPYSNTPKFRIIYNQMISLEERVIGVINTYYFENNKYPESTDLKLLLNQKDNLRIPKTHLFIRDIFSDFISHSEKEKRVQKSTIAVYKSTLVKWIEFENEMERKIRLIDISFKTLEDFKTHLKSKNLIHSSVGKSIKTIKTLLNSYVIKREKINIDLSFKEVKVDGVMENNFQTLSEKEFELLKQAVFYSQFKLDDNTISLTKSEKTIGRMFLFMCSTGISYVDLMNLTLQNIIITEQKLLLKDSVDSKSLLFVYIDLTRQKTRHEAKCIIPILGLTIELLISILGKPIEFMGEHVREIPNQARIKILQRILKEKKKFDVKKSVESYRIFNPVSNQVFNRLIKNLFDKLGLHETIQIRRNRNENETEIKRKCDLISTHTARRTYITLCLAKGIRPDQLMQTTGHKKFETMKKYTKYTPMSINEEFVNKMIQ
jgi:site-specific recombinase XerD